MTAPPAGEWGAGSLTPEQWEAVFRGAFDRISGWLVGAFPESAQLAYWLPVYREDVVLLPPAEAQERLTAIGMVCIDAGVQAMNPDPAARAGALKRILAALQARSN